MIYLREYKIQLYNSVIIMAISKFNLGHAG